MNIERSVNILPEQIANRIAAGEVVERPASIVKELVENSLDAGATSVSIAVSRGGKDHISVVDNGHGMSEANLLKALKRFGTSKIQAAEDLDEILTFGFRGEAIPAICSIAKVTIRSRTADSDQGTEVSVEAGELVKKSSGPFELGTRIEIYSLFFNVPARQKFLKSDNSETIAVKSVVTDFVLSNPGINFSLTMDGKPVNLGRPAMSIVEKAKELGLGGSSSFEIDSTKPTGMGELSLCGIMSQPVAAAASANKIRIFVNKRAVRDRVLLGAIKQAYGNYLRPGEFPQGVLSLTVPPTEVDVNVHPQKSEVKFRRSELVFHFVSSALKEALGEHAGADVARFYRESYSFPQQNFSFNRYSPAAEAVEAGYLSIDSVAEGDLREKSADRNLEAQQLKFVAQIFKCFLLFESGEDLLLMDMHAAHERVYFWRLATQLEQGGVSTQLLLTPEVVDLPSNFVEQFVANTDTLASFGLNIDAAGPDLLLVRSIPALLAGTAPGELIDELVRAIEIDTQASSKLVDLLHSVITRVACHYSIRSGRELEREEAYALVESLRSADSSGLCPHGRPVMRYLSRYDLEKLFGRVSF